MSKTKSSPSVSHQLAFEELVDVICDLRDVRNDGELKIQDPEERRRLERIRDACAARIRLKKETDLSDWCDGKSQLTGYDAEDDRPDRSPVLQWKSKFAAWGVGGEIVIALPDGTVQRIYDPKFEIDSTNIDIAKALFFKVDPRMRKQFPKLIPHLVHADIVKSPPPNENPGAIYSAFVRPRLRLPDQKEWSQHGNGPNRIGGWYKFVASLPEDERDAAIRWIGTLSEQEV